MSARTILVCLPLALLLGLGCMKPNPLVYTLGDEAAEGDADSGDGDGDGDTLDEGGEVPLDVEASEVCDALDAYPPSCGSCLAGGCCDLLAACAQVQDCECLAACTLAGGNVGSCKIACNNAKAGEIAELQPVLDCAADICAADC